MAGNSPIINSARIFKVIRQKAYSATLATLENAARGLLKHFAEEKKFFSITGNAFTSFAVGIFYKGRLVSMFSMADDAEAPTRVTLRKNEVYDKDEYYDGPIAVDPETGDLRPYRGTFGSGGQYGPTLGPWYLRRQHFPKRQTWELVVVLPVAYAGYNVKITRTMQRLMLELPQIVDYNVVRVENAPSQSEIFQKLKEDTMRDMGQGVLDAPF